jgi:hypothetical protein
MKIAFKSLILLALGAGMFTLNSCSDEPSDDVTPTPAEPICYMTLASEDGDSTSFNYNSTNQVISSKNDGTITTYEYSGGILSTAFDGYTEATFIYTTGNIPSRINIKEDGKAAGYWIIENSSGNITKVEIHDSSDQVTEVTVATYVSGNLSTMLLQEWDTDLKDFVTSYQLSNVITDGKKNPYSTSFALVYANSGNPFVFGKTNITSVTLTQNGVSLPATVEHTYNANNYPITSKLKLSGTLISDNAYIYNCK